MKPIDSVRLQQNNARHKDTEWAIEMHRIMIKFFGYDWGRIRGIEVLSGNRKKPIVVGILELDIGREPTQAFLSFIGKYKSENIKGITYEGEVNITETDVERIPCTYRYKAVTSERVVYRNVIMVYLK